MHESCLVNRHCQVGRLLLRTVSAQSGASSMCRALSTAPEMGQGLCRGAHAKRRAPLGQFSRHCARAVPRPRRKRPPRSISGPLRAHSVSFQSARLGQPLNEKPKEALRANLLIKSNGLPSGPTLSSNISGCRPGQSSPPTSKVADQANPLN